MEGDTLKEALTQDAAQKHAAQHPGIDMSDPEQVAWYETRKKEHEQNLAERRAALGLPPNTSPDDLKFAEKAARAKAAGLSPDASEDHIRLREREMRDLAERASKLVPDNVANLKVVDRRPAIDPATGKPPLVPDEAQQALEGKPGAETVTINSAALVVQIEQKTALVSKIVACALAETARSLLPELNEPGEKTREVIGRDEKGNVVKQNVPRHNLNRMKDTLTVLDSLATQAERWDILGDKAQLRVPAVATPEVTVPKTDPDLQPEVVPPGAGDL